MAHTLDSILKAVKAKDGKVDGRSGPIRVQVRPASFVSDGKHGAYKAGEIVRSVRVGRFNLSPWHVEAILDACGVSLDTVDVDKLSDLFAMKVSD